MYRAIFELIWKNLRSKRKVDDISYGRKESRGTFLQTRGRSSRIKTTMNK
jgi:hypothetical protein